MLTDKKYSVEYLERQLFNLSKLVDINSVINATLDIGKLLSVVMESIKDIMDAEASTLLLYEEDSNDLVFKVALGEAGDELQERYRVGVGQGVAGWVAEHREALFINDAYSDIRFDPSFDKKTGFITKSLVCAPLLFKGKLVGVIQAINPINRPGFNDDDLALFKAFANQAVLAVQNAVLFKSVVEERRLKQEIAAARSALERIIEPAVPSYKNFSITIKHFAARELSAGCIISQNLFNTAHAVVLGCAESGGIPGAIKAGMLWSAAKTILTQSSSADAVLHSMSELAGYCVSERAAFSFFYGIFSDTHTVEFIKTEGTYPLLIRGGKGHFLRFSASTNNSAAVQRGTVTLEKGDLLMIVTESLVSLKNRRGQEFGLKGVVHAVKDVSNTADAVARLADSTAQFLDMIERRDDITIGAVMLK